MKRRMFCVIIGLIISGFCIFSPGNLSALEKKMTQATQTTVPIKIDGVLKEISWKNTPPIKGFSPFNQAENLFPEDTQARILFDKDFVYIGIEAQESCPDWQAQDIKEAAGKFEYRLANVIELFLDTNLDRFTYDQFMLHVNGTTEVNPSDVMKIAGMFCKSAVCFEKDHFTMEIAIPLAVLHLTPETKNTWGFNIGRARFCKRLLMKGPNSVYSIWNNTGGAFNVPARFGDLEIKSDFSDFYYRVKVNDGFKRGDKSIPITVHNQTGKARSLNVVMQLERLDGKILRWEKPLRLEAAEIGMVDFSHNVAPDDLGGKLVVDLKEGERLVYRGGTSRRERPAGLLNGALAKDKLPESPVIIFSRDYTEPVYPASLPRTAEITNTLSVKAAPGEYEPITFALYARDAEVKARLEIADDFTDGEKRISRRHLDTRIVGYNNFWFSSSEYQRIPLFLRLLYLEPESTLTICQAATVPREESVRFWMTVHVPPDAEAGKYTMPLKVHLNNGTSLSLQINLEVYPFTLLKPKVAFGMYHQATGLPPAKRTRDYQRLMFEDMAAHGMNTVTMYLYPIKSSMEISTPPFFGVIPAMEDFMNSGLGNPEVPVVVLGAGNYGADVRKNMIELAKKRGWPEWLFYTIDEPEDDERIAACRVMCQNLKKEVPGIKLTTAIGKRGIEGTGDLLDVWIAGQIDDGVISMAKKQNKELWTYGGQGTPEAERLMTGLYTWSTGIGGVLQWAYLDGPAFNRMGRPLGSLVSGTSLSRWDLYEENPEEVNWGYDAVWPGAVGPEPTIGWELRREGIDDYRYLITLEKVIREKEKTNPDTEKVKEAKKLLSQIRSMIKADAFLGVVGGGGDFDFSPGMEATDYAKIREEVASAITALTEGAVPFKK